MEVKTTIEFKKWYKSLKDKKTRALIQSRFRRIELNDNFGDFKSLGSKILELRIDFGPGYRIYFSRKKGMVLILLGSIKKNQARALKKLNEIRRGMDW